MKKRRKQGLWLRRNLPLLIAAAALVLLILIIVLVAKGCSKTSDTTIQAEAFSTKTTIGLPVSAELNSADFVSYGGYQFTTKKSLSAMSKLVTKNNDGVTAESFTNSYGTCAVFTKANESGGTDTWCLYAKDPQNTKNWYIFFMGEHRELALESGTLDLLLPLHLITDAELLDTMFATLQPGTPYTCGLDKLPDGQTLSSLFRTFYETSGLYTVTGSDSGFTLVPRGGAQELTFQFDEQDGSGRFMISVPQNTEPQPTASAVVADVIDEAKHLTARKTLFWGPAEPGYVRDHRLAPAAMLVRFTCEKDAGALVQIGRTFGDVRMVSVPDAPEDEVAFVTPCMPEYLLTEKFDSFKGMRLVRALRIYMH